MAGKLHKSYADLASATALALAPQGKLARAYAEGYQAQRADMTKAATAPFTQASDPVRYQAWLGGAMNAYAIFPPTHVGGPLPVAPPPPPPAPLRSSRR